jgi:hypothetical protein
MAVDKAVDKKRAEERRKAVSGLFSSSLGASQAQTATERRTALNSTLRALTGIGGGQLIDANEAQ